jgi:hypothetical protein
VKTLVFSLDRADRKPDAQEYETMRNHMLTGKILVNNAQGVFDGEQETAFICLVDTELQEQMVMAIAHAYKQKCILEIELPSREGYAKYISGEPRKYLGLWTEVSPNVKVDGDFTVNTESMRVFKCLPATVDKTVSA